MQALCNQWRLRGDLVIMGTSLFAIMFCDNRWFTSMRIAFARSPFYFNRDVHPKPQAARLGQHEL